MHCGNCEIGLLVACFCDDTLLLCKGLYRTTPYHNNRLGFPSFTILMQSSTHGPLKDVAIILVSVISTHILTIDILRICYENGLSLTQMNPIRDRPTLAQVIAWGRQATSYYLCRCWPRSVSSYGANRQQCIKNVCKNIDVRTVHLETCTHGSWFVWFLLWFVYSQIIEII